MIQIKSIKKSLPSLILPQHDMPSSVYHILDSKDLDFQRHLSFEMFSNEQSALQL